MEMIWPLPSWVGPAVIAAALAFGGLQTLRLSWAQEAHAREIADIRQAQQTAVDEANMRANQAALRYEEWKAAQRPRVVTVIKEVDRALQTNSAWAAQPLPDSVRDALRAARTIDHATQPDSTVPAMGPGRSDDQR